MGKDASSVAVAVRSAGDFEVLPEDTELFQSHLRSFVPPEAFDAHAHFYERSHIGPTYASSYLKECPRPRRLGRLPAAGLKMDGGPDGQGRTVFRHAAPGCGHGRRQPIPGGGDQPGGSAESPDADPSRGRSGPGGGTDRLPGIRGL